jgi:hypothetical protein
MTKYKSDATEPPAASLTQAIQKCSDHNIMSVVHVVLEGRGCRNLIWWDRIRFHSVNPVVPLSPVCSIRTVQQLLSHDGVRHLHEAAKEVNIVPRDESGDGAQHTAIVRTRLHTRDSLPIPLDRCDLRILERV